MRPVVNVMLDRFERQTLERTERWRGLIEDKEHLRHLADQVGVLRHLSQRDPGGLPWKTLDRGRQVLTAIRETAQEELDTWTAVAETTPEEGHPDSIIAKPRMAALVIVDSRRDAIRDVGEALQLIEAALQRATPPIDDRVEDI